MVIPWIIGGAVAVLLVRWVYVYLKRRSYDRALEHRIRNRQDLHKL